MNWNNTVLGLELGSTRIKAILIDENHIPVASGSFEWENQMENKIWTYSLDAVKHGIRTCFAELKKEAETRSGVPLTTVAGIGISGMMHGYLPFGKSGEQLAAFRTWRNTMTEEEAAELTSLFGFNIPQRWSIAHLYHSIRNQEPHVKEIDYLTTLAGYVHWMLTGKRVMGIGEASGMFPIDSVTKDYDSGMMEKFDRLIESCGYEWKLRDILPEVLTAGESGGYLTAEGAEFLDPSGTLQPGIPVAPCEGDAGTGMAATNSVRAGTGNVSAGTSDFAMIVTDHPLGVHREIDMVTTPTGLPVAMVHCNNCTSDINAWVGLFAELADTLGAPVEKGELFQLLFRKAMEGDPDCGGLISFNYLSGESITGFAEGRPLFVRMENSRFNLANFMRTHLLSSLATLKIGMDILTQTEKVSIEKLYGHGGFFKTPEVGQRMLSAAVDTPVSVMKTAGEGGPYGMALLTAYMIRKETGESLEDYLENKVFAGLESHTVTASANEVAGFESFLDRYLRGLPVERAAVESL